VGLVASWPAPVSTGARDRDPTRRARGPTRLRR
jgi:hypothetical protein